jgi:shikimate kinase
MTDIRNIVLVGFMGVGKGSLARALVRETGRFAVDTDDLIESMENRKIKDIFQEDGEEYFRALEVRTAEWLEQNVSNCIISTGGGFHAVDNLNQIGIVVYLKSDFDTIINKILSHPKAARKIEKRPLLKDQEQARLLLQKREPEYSAKADITIDVAGRKTGEILKELLAALPPECVV